MAPAEAREPVLGTPEPRPISPWLDGGHRRRRRRAADIRRPEAAASNQDPKAIAWRKAQRR